MVHWTGEYKKCNMQVIYYVIILKVIAAKMLSLREGKYDLHLCRAVSHEASQHLIAKLMKHQFHTLHHNDSHYLFYTHSSCHNFLSQPHDFNLHSYLLSLSFTILFFFHILLLPIK
ncbi:hypothetical protein OTU49_002222 [Cherax quadricarinatus]|uniref:Uncharacterized protein n=1 Tax=Cherax quadricarinatus TaxID=27406 RepID=A0AAW0XAC4_CHEQU